MLIIMILLFLFVVNMKSSEASHKDIQVYVCPECNETDCDCHLVENQNFSEPGKDQ